MAEILIADDEDGVRAFLDRALAGRGHSVATVADGAAAIEALQKKTFDLLLADIVMPLMDGIALALKAGKDFPDLRIVLMTGYAAERDRAYNLDALVDAVVEKPFTLDDICATVDTVLAAKG